MSTTAAGRSSTTPAHDPLGHLADDLAQVRSQGLYRPLRVMSSANRTRVTVDGREAITLASNNYLGLNTHPRLVEASLDALRRFGAGSGAVRTISGTMALHEELESELARFKHVEATLTFQSGFTCNTGVIPVVAAEPDLIVSDALSTKRVPGGHEKDVPSVAVLLGGCRPRLKPRRASVRYDAGRYGRRGPATTPGELQPPEAA